MNVSGFQVSVDWSKCFTLNGPLDAYEVLENGLLIYEGKQTKRDFGTRRAGEYTYVVKATTAFKGQKKTVEAPPSEPVTLQGEANFNDQAWYRRHISIFQTTTVFDALFSVVIVSRRRLVKKAGKLQRSVSLLRFLLDHVRLTVHMKFSRWRIDGAFMR